MPVPCQAQKPAPKGAGFFYPFISSPSFWEEGLRWGRVLFLSSPSLWEGRTKEGEGNLLSPIPPLNLPPLRHKSERGGRNSLYILPLSLGRGERKKRIPLLTQVGKEETATFPPPPLEGEEIGGGLMIDLTKK